MAHLITKVYRIIGAEPRCRPGCGRTLSVALAEQTDAVEECPLGHCKFKKEIKEAIRLSKKPELITFTTNKRKMLASEMLTVTWELLNVDVCTLKGFGKISSKGTKHINLKKTSNLFLEFKAFNGDVYNSEPIDIEVYPDPEEVSFKITKNEIIRGESISITWEAKNVISASLKVNGNEYSVAHKAEIEMIPEDDIEIQLELIGHLNSSILKSEMITVHEPAKINSFSVNNSIVLENDVIGFEVDVKDASKIVFSGPSLQNERIVRGNERIDVVATITNNHSTIQTYQLEVFDLLNNALPKRYINIEVFPQPIILDFTLSKDKILIGEKVEITWNVRNFTEINLIIGNKPVDITNLKTYELLPKETSTIKLIVSSLGNIKTIESEIRILQVFNFVQLNFIADKLYIVQSTPVRLKWIAKNASNVYLNTKENPLSLSGEMIVYPNETTEYSIYAYNDLDNKKSNLRINVFDMPVVSNINLPKLPTNILPAVEQTMINSNYNNIALDKLSVSPPQNLSFRGAKTINKRIHKKSIIEGYMLLKEVVLRNISTGDILKKINKKLDS